MSFQQRARIKLNAGVKGHTDCQMFSSITNLPPSIRTRLDGIADAGQEFSVGCVISPGIPTERFLAASKRGQLYTVAIEYGGFIHNWTLLEFILDEAGEIKSLRRVEPDDAANGSQPFRPETITTSLEAGSRR